MAGLDFLLELLCELARAESRPGPPNVPPRRRRLARFYIVIETRTISRCNLSGRLLDEKYIDQLGVKPAIKNPAHRRRTHCNVVPPDRWWFPPLDRRDLYSAKVGLVQLVEDPFLASGFWAVSTSGVRPHLRLIIILLAHNFVGCVHRRPL